MVKKVITLLAFAALGVFCAMAVQAETVRGEGKYHTQALTHLMPFSSIEVRGDAQVDVWQRAEQSVSVSGKSNLVALADIRVENNTLIIDFKRPIHIKGAHALHVSVGVPSLQSVSVRSKGRMRIRGAFETPKLLISAMDKAYITGDMLQNDWLRVQATNHAEIDLERLQAKQLEAAVFDKADVELSGAAEQAQLINNGAEDLDAAGLRVAQAHVQINGSGDVELFATDTLKAEALGRGEITYHGRPVLTRGGNVKHIKPAFED